MKNAKNLLLLAIITTLFTACKEKNGGEIVDIGIDILVENSAGQNLFLSTTPGALDPNSIKLIYKIGGEDIEFYQGNLDCPRNVCFISDLGSERILVFPNDAENDKYPVTYIQWKEGDLDTLKCHFIRKNQGGHIVCDSAWFNAVQVYPPNALVGFDRAFKIIK
ncbi:MAG: hypothetical protein RIR11_2309 [Bacteroidota bacterium]|jgi:hypothetical protein